jgi:sulfonate transport system ATP-binding protein
MTDIMLGARRIEGPGAERGLIFQEHRLFPWLTVRKNVGLGLEAFDAAEADARIDEHIALVGLSDFEHAYPHQLSGGMAQRAAIARALVTRPDILLLDEPLGALDSLTRSYLQNELLRIWQRERITMVMVTHDVEEAAYLSDKIVVMAPRPGRIKSVVPAPLDRPRRRASPEFADIKEQVFSLLS